jgi:uncharacterized protein
VTSRSYVARLVDSWLDELIADTPGVLLVGPRGTGKTTTAQRHARTTLRLDRPEVRAAVQADADAVLADADRPVLVDEWQLVPECLAAAKRLIDAEPAPGRFVFTGSAADDAGTDQWPGTGRFIRVPIWGLSRREVEGSVEGETFVDRIIDAPDPEKQTFALPSDRPDISGYLDRALQSGFPEALARTSERTRTAWLDSYIDHLVGRDLALIAEVRDPLALRRYLRALAASTAGEPATETLLGAADVSRATADRYDALLERLFVSQRVPAWSSNHLSRVSVRAKRYICDPAVAAALVGADRRMILRDGDLSGRLLDTFVASQLRPELSLGRLPSAMFHLRHDGGRHEADIVVERRDGFVVAMEVKSAAAVDIHDARHLVWLRDSLPAGQMVAGLVLHTGPNVVRLDRRIWAVPICALWA